MKKSLLAFLSVVYVFFILCTPVIHAQDASTKKSSEKMQKSDYVIGPEDVLHIFVWKEESLTKTVPVRIDGKISLPLLDDVQAAGLTPLQLKEQLIIKLKAFVDNPTVTVTVIEANSFKVYISGEVRQPGIVRIRNEVTLAQLIIMVGGFTEWANKRKILIITREGDKEKRITADYNKIIRGDIPDIIIKRGDTVIVP
jgi:polysaccharide export outer membrane protein